ncbi:HAMP domain-containing sensor histidine kinase [Chryseobacterium sp. ISL-6]|uniref:sensor histidine kinase n=1 Tax=Chryseobacterium sp. ISL-6 TaxID=2819143 RepID=UPI001BEBBBE3|nr:HAMP domain-containing sensor histidine kinase [Chryseobacterium sp. ISL-6]MBT2621660.1 HAMP domain-containing histidine kinase [Chryseobacterium sp. ISL-6]
MNLLNKISIWFIAIVLLVTPLSMYISYTNIKKRLDNVEIERLRSVNNYVASQLKRGETPEKTSQGLPISIKPYAGSGIVPTNPEIIHTCLDNNGISRNECKIQINSFVTAANKTYKISSYSYITSTEQIMQGMLSALILKVLLITFIVFVTARILSRYILKPFHHAIDNIHHFNIQKKEPLDLLPTSTNEFKKLNEFLRLMTDKAIEDYASVKEFSENASHEVQTPLAIIQSKIELLAETEINGKQAALLTDIQNSIDKLSRINRSLILLTKLNNHEFLTEQKLKFCRVEKETINAYSDHIALKNITLNRNCEKDVFIKIHPALAEILLSNLLSNAIRHNLKNGNIEINLTSQFFQISNTGLPPDIPTQELFKRFKKSNQSTESIGLGLSIVKQICEVNAFPVYYDFVDGWHSITVYFSSIENHVLFVPAKICKNPLTKIGSVQPNFNFAE